MKNHLIKIKVKVLLALFSLLRNIGYFIFFLFEKIGQLLIGFLLIMIKIFIFLTAPFYLKIKRTVKESLSNFHYQKESISYYLQKGIIFLSLFLIIIFVFFEGKTSFEEQFFAEALASEEENREEIISDLKITREEVEPEEAAIKPSLTFEEEFTPTRTEIEKYVVEPGDTLSSIAEDFGVSLNTILWENKLTLRSIIRPGQVLKILPVSGVSHKIKQGETIGKIAQLYRANPEDIIRFNELEEGLLKVGEIIIIPDGRIPPPPPAPVVSRGKDKIWPAKVGATTRQGTNCRNFYPGQCTWYIAQKICIPWSGHAKDWMRQAPKYGWLIGKTPQVGAIVSTKDNRWYGHVALVEEVKIDSIVISEMNYLRPWLVNRREIKTDDWRINGYIYPP